MSTHSAAPMKIAITIATPPIRGTGALPFAVAAPHQAPGAGDVGAVADLESTATQLDAHLQGLAEQLLQLESARDALQAQYDETAALLQQTVSAHEQAGQT